MARVYLALQESLQRPVAVKLLDNPDIPGFHERFMKEGRFLAALGHSNIVEVYDVGECEGNYFITMEYLPGGDLRSRIQKGMKPGLALKVAMRIASCLDYLHEQGIVHRDLKPSNILFRADSNPVITDFGIAKLLHEKGDLTLGEAILGSPSYLSPEQAGAAGKVDGRSDLYSLGVILFEMLTGERPYQGENFAAVIMAHQRDPIPKLPGALSHYQPVIDRLLCKEVVGRYQNGVELIQAIRGLTTAEIHQLPGSSSQPSPQPPVIEESKAPPAKRSRGFRFKLLFLTMLLLSAAGFLLFKAPLHESAKRQNVGVEQKPAVQPEIPLAESVLQQHPEPVIQPVVPKPAFSVVKRRPSPQQRVQPKLSKADQLLSLAYQRMDSLRLSFPKGDSAYDYFQQILVLDPQNKAAKAGIRQIVRWYINKAEQALTDDKIKQAKRYVDRGLTINRNNPRLIALQNRIQTPVAVNAKVFDPFEILNY